MLFSLVTINSGLSSESMLRGFLNSILGFGLLVFLIALGFVVFYLVSLWKLFQKANEPGWACLVPLYNYYTLYKMAFGNGWWFLFLFVPVANFIFTILLAFKLAQAFNKDVGYGFGLLFLSPIFYPILAFGDAIYVGPR